MFERSRQADGREGWRDRGGRGLASLLVMALLGLLSAGCAGGPGGSSANSSGGRSIERLDLLLTSVALNLDGRPGPDGFGARVYASSRQSAVGGSIVDGKLVFQMFDGVVRGEDLKTAVPLRTWSYSAEELKPFLHKTSIGASYVFALAWGDQQPSGERITVTAHCVSSGGNVVSAAPGTIPLSVK